jgi:hypothetical protein
MRHRSHRRKKLSKFADNYGLLVFKVLLAVVGALLAGLITYFISTVKGARF